MPKKSRTPRLIEAERWEHPVPGLVYEQTTPAPGSLAFSIMRRVPCPFVVETEVPGRNFWVVELENDNWGLNASPELRTHYVLPVPRKSKARPWLPQELAIACAKRLSEYRGWVMLRRFEDNICRFSAVFASNSMWTFCVSSTDLELCPIVRAVPPGTVMHPSGMVIFPEGTPRGETCSPHHEVPKARDAQFCKLAQKLLP